MLNLTYYTAVRKSLASETFFSTCRERSFEIFSWNVIFFLTQNGIYSRPYSVILCWSSPRSRAPASNTSQLSRTCEVNLWEGTSHFSHARDQHVRDTKSIVFSVAKALMVLESKLVVLVVGLPTQISTTLAKVIRNSLN